jgi:predicted O-methyltransferase YrrM
MCVRQVTDDSNVKAVVLTNEEAAEYGALKALWLSLPPAQQASFTASLASTKGLVAQSAYMATTAGRSGARPVRDVLLRELWSNDDPFAYSLASNVDTGYTHTNLLPVLVEAVLSIVKPVFWLEAGSMLGGSAIMTAKAVKARPELATSVVCLDPWTGDVNMWAWERGLLESKQWRFMKLTNGAPTIYDRFRANVVANKVDDVMVPVLATSIVGMKLLIRLAAENRLGGLSTPEVIFLDSAHEKKETMLELELAWKLLAPGGILLGDDFTPAWLGVVEDVPAFAETVDVNEAVITQLMEVPGMSRVGKVLHLAGLWVLTKPA